MSMFNSRGVAVVGLLALLSACGGGGGGTDIPMGKDPGIVDPGVSDPGPVDPGIGDLGSKDPGVKDPGTDDAYDSSVTADSSDVDGPQSVSATIGSEGGEFALGDVHLQVPPGALDSPTMLTITESAQDTIESDVFALSQVYRFEPDGLQFQVPVTVTFAYDSEPILKPAYEEYVSVYWTDPSGEFQALPSVVDTTGDTVSAQADHFSKGASCIVIIWTSMDTNTDICDTGPCTYGCCSGEKPPMICHNKLSDAACGPKGGSCDNCQAKDPPGFCLKGKCAPCNADTCPGCCRPDGSCQPGTAQTSCGWLGQACVDCSKSVPVPLDCVDRECAPCNQDSCWGGCCSDQGECILDSTNDSMCGKYGNPCEDCKAKQPRETCVNGFCKPCEDYCEGCCEPTVNGFVECHPGDDDKSCGSGGATCVYCLGKDPSQVCVNSQCTDTGCVPDCASKYCGDDGCGGSCGTCPATHQCLEGDCTCTPDCDGKQCGPDGCGNFCPYNCPPNLTACLNHQCIKKCNSTTCKGCCTKEDECRNGDSDYECGGSGLPCLDCKEAWTPDRECLLGNCVPASDCGGCPNSTDFCSAEGACIVQGDSWLNPIVIVGGFPQSVDGSTATFTDAFSPSDTGFDCTGETWCDELMGSTGGRDVFYAFEAVPGKWYEIQVKDLSFKASAWLSDEVSWSTTGPGPIPTSGIVFGIVGTGPPGETVIGATFQAAVDCPQCTSDSFGYVLGIDGFGPDEYGSFVIEVTECGLPGCEPVTVGACCDQETGDCTATAEAGCAFWLGPDVACDPDPCTGACCFKTGLCTEEKPWNCEAKGGSFQAGQTSCSPNPCPQMAACCNQENGECTLKAGDDCDEGFTFFPNEAKCEADTCPINCPNGTCGTNETPCTCAQDCGAQCGDGCCSGDEDTSSCCEDCGLCGQHGCEWLCVCDPGCCTVWTDACEKQCAGYSCGDGTCQPCENEDNCPFDCGTPECGDGVCGPDENSCTCQEDCLASCGNGCCDFGEDQDTCCVDCGIYPTFGCPAMCGFGQDCAYDWTPLCENNCNATQCGDGSCVDLENTSNCPQDCGASCGDGVCNGDEYAFTCPQDCALNQLMGCPEIGECDPACIYAWPLWTNGGRCIFECGAYGIICGDDICMPCFEDPTSCPQDCP